MHMHACPYITLCMWPIIERFNNLVRDSPKYLAIWTVHQMFIASWPKSIFKLLWVVFLLWVARFYTCWLPLLFERLNSCQALDWFSVTSRDKNSVWHCTVMKAIVHRLLPDYQRDQKTHLKQDLGQDHVDKVVIRQMLGVSVWAGTLGLG